MPPKKQSRAEAAAAKKADAESHEQDRLATIAADELLVRHSDASPALKVSDIFATVIKRKDFKSRVQGAGREPFDWSALRAALAARTAASPTWFMHVRAEDLILDPDGLDGETVEVAVVVEATEPTLAPMHMVVREARPFSDLEDNTPERVLALADFGFCWREVRGDAGEVINVFLLRKKDADKPPALPAGRSFSFGAAAPAAPAAAAAAPAAAAAAAPVVAGFGQAAQSQDAPAKAASGFGFGSSGDSTAAAPAKAASGFGFGNSAAAAAPAAAAAAPAPTGFGFGNSSAATAASALSTAAKSVGAAPTPFAAAAAPAKAASGFGFGNSAAAAPVAAAAAPATFAGRPVSPKPPTVPQVGGTAAAAAPAAAGFAAGFGKQASAAGASASSGLGANVTVENVQFTLWSEDRLKEMKKEILAGSRIVIEDFPLPAPVNRKAKLQMQNDLKDKVEATVEFIVRKEFALLCPPMKKVNDWIEACPVYEEKLTGALQKFRERQLDEAIEESDESEPEGYAAVDKALRPLLTAEFEKRVAERKAMLDKEAAAIDDIMQLVKKKRVLATKECYKIYKYYPKNDKLRFRPFGKVGGVHEAGESADVCEPPAYVAKNLFAARVAAMNAAGGNA